MKNPALFEALGTVESNLTLCECTARLLHLLPLEEIAQADEIIAISNALELQLERTHKALDGAYNAYKEGKENDT